MAETRGRKRTPTAKKKAQGTVQPSRVNENEPVPIGKLGPAPDWFDGDALEIWQWAVENCWWLTIAERVLVEQFCLTAALLRKRQKSALKDEKWTPSDRHLSEMSARHQAALGMDPTSRAKINIPEVPKEGEWARFKTD